MKGKRLIEEKTEVCPDVFFHNEETHTIEIADLHSYPVEKVEKAINMCPGDCIYWESG
ncbi:MAG: ferredoxin [Deltaproteobacteria bacterium]|nr:ferredoxin [Deltaproteobacteria bacterium]